MELTKKLQGTEAIDDGSRLFNAEREEELEMIRIRNAGIREAIGVLSDWLKAAARARDIRQFREE